MMPSSFFQRKKATLGEFCASCRAVITEPLEPLRPDRFQATRELSAGGALLQGPREPWFLPADPCSLPV